MKTQKKFIGVLAMCMVLFMSFGRIGIVHAAGSEIESATIVSAPIVKPGDSIVEAKALVDVPKGCVVESGWMVWSADEDDYVKIEDGVFDEDGVYYQQIKFSVENGYTISPSFELKYAEGIEHGSEWSEEDEDGNVSYYCDLSRITFTTQIYKVNITIPEVAPGNLATINEIKLYAGDEMVTIESVEVDAEWICPTDNYEIVTGKAFEDGKLYQLQVNLAAKKGYTFANEVSMCINGEDASGFAYPKDLQLFADYTLLPAVEKIELAGLPEEKAGEVMVDTLEMISERDDYEIFVYWFDENGEEVTGEVMKAGEKYTVQIEVNLFGDAPISEDFVYVVDVVEYKPTELSMEGNQAWLEIEYDLSNNADDDDKTDGGTTGGKENESEDKEDKNEGNKKDENNSSDDLITEELAPKTGDFSMTGYWMAMFIAGALFVFFVKEKM